MAVMSDAAVFIDKDGTLIDDVPYNVDPDRIRLAPGVRVGVRRLHERGFRLVVVSNQGGVARGYFTEDALFGVEERLRDLLRGFGVPLAGFYYCPHDPVGRIKSYATACTCRKPRPGLFQRAAREGHFDLRRSWCIGDILDDVEAGHAAGCRSILIDNGNETRWDLSERRVPDYIARDLDEAAGFIIDSSDPGRPVRPRSFARQ